MKYRYYKSLVVEHIYFRCNNSNWEYTYSQNTMNAFPEEIRKWCPSKFYNHHILEEITKEEMFNILL